MSLFHDLGGSPTLAAALQSFLQRLSRDPRTAPLLRGLDPGPIGACLQSTLSMACGGPGYFSGAELRSAREHLSSRGFSEGHLGLALTHLASSFEELGVPADLVVELRGIAAGFRRNLLSGASSRPNRWSERWTRAALARTRLALWAAQLRSGLGRYRLSTGGVRQPDASTPAIGQQGL